VFGQFSICEAIHEIAEPHNRGQYGHDSRISESESRSIQTVIVSRRSGHLIEGGHIRGRLRVGSFGITQTLVGGFANCPQGIPVLPANATADPEIARVADNGLGA